MRKWLGFRNSSRSVVRVGNWYLMELLVRCGQVGVQVVVSLSVHELCMTCPSAYQ